jgi:hypothetical protein
MTAGIVLGPSFRGRFFPGSFAYVFPSSSSPALTALSEVGLLLFMFVVGLGVDLKRILKQSAAVVLISNISIALPQEFIGHRGYPFTFIQLQIDRQGQGRGQRVSFAKIVFDNKGAIDVEPMAVGTGANSAMPLANVHAVSQ